MRASSLAATLLIAIGPITVMGDGGSGSAQRESTEEFFHRIKSHRVVSDPSVEWRSVGPGMSGYNEKFWPHPTDPDTLFLGPDMHVSYGSWDGGESWQSLKDPDESGQLMKRVLDIEFSRQDPDFAMALDWNGWIYESRDRGRSWTKNAELSPNYRDRSADPWDPLAFKNGWYDEQIGTRLGELAVDPTDDSTWYVGAGDFWNIKENHRSLDSLHGNRLNYADYGYILKTEDRGRTWTKISEGLPDTLDVGRIVVNPFDPSHLLVLSNHGLMSSHDGGASWRDAGAGLPNNLPRDLVTHHDSESGRFQLFLVEQTVYEKQGDTVKSRGGVFRSDDAGESWTDITGNLAIDLNRIDYPAEIARYYRTLANWFGLSEAAARARFPELPSSVLPVFNFIAVNPLDPDEIYVSYNKKHDRTFGPGEVWRTLDGGRNWQVVARHGAYWHSGKDSSYWAGRNNPVHPNVEFAHLQTYMDRHEESSGNRLLAINPAGEVFISIDQQTQKSSDKGERWVQIDDFETSPGSGRWIGRGASDLPGRFMLLETGIPGRKLLASGEHGLWQTTGLDGWPDARAIAVEQIEGQVHADGMVSISTVAVHPNNPDTIYLLAWRQRHAGKLRRTTDGGRTWKNIATVLAGPGRDVDSQRLGKVIQGPIGMLPAQNSLLIDPINPDNMYFVATELANSEIYRAPRNTPVKGGFGFMRSSDGGYNWQVSNEGFHEGISLRRIALDPADPSIIYAAANDDNGGLYRSTDRGANWSRITTPPSVKNVNNVFIDRHTGRLFISAGGFYGSASAAGGAWCSDDRGETWRRIFEAPLVLQVESSPVNPDLLLLTAGNKMRSDPEFMNPGLYLSLDGGGSWRKINRGLGNNDKIIDAKPDPHDRNVLWAAAWGSGWFIGRIETTGKRP